MKIKVDVDVTPQELREFFGLPDVHALQEELIEQIRSNVKAGVEGFDAMNLLRPLVPANLQTLETFQKAFWQGFASPKGSSKASEDDG